MKRLQIALICLMATLISVPTIAQDTGIEFEHGTVAEVLKKAKKQKKLVFIDAYTDWCGPCKWMAANVFVDEKVGEVFNKHFINYKLDMEKGEGPDFAKKYEVRAYPTLLFIDGDGNLVHKQVGGANAENFIAVGEDVADGIEPIGVLTAKFESGDYDRDWLHAYIMRMTRAGMKCQDAVNEFKKEMVGEKMLDEKNWEVFTYLFRRIDTDQFLYVMDHLDQFREKFGKEKVDRKLAGNYNGLLWAHAREGEEDKYNAIRTQALATDLEGLEAAVYDLDLVLYQGKYDSVTYAHMAYAYFKAGRLNSPWTLNNIAWDFQVKHKDTDILDMGIEMVERSLEIEKNGANVDTYAMILFKRGRLQEARDQMLEAIQLMKEAGEEVGESEKGLKEIEAALQEARK